MANYTNRFTVINRKAKPTEAGRLTERNAISQTATLKDSKINLRTLNKETGVFKDESKVRGIVRKKAGTLSKESVSGATFRWEIEFNGQYQLVKDAVTQKELQSVFAITNTSEDTAVNGFQAGINDIAEPLGVGVSANAGNSITTVAISGNDMNTLYTNHSFSTKNNNNNNIFVGNLQPSPPHDNTLTNAFINVLIATQSPEPQNNSSTGC